MVRDVGSEGFGIAACFATPLYFCVCAAASEGSGAFGALQGESQTTSLLSCRFPRDHEKFSRLLVRHPKGLQSLPIS